MTSAAPPEPRPPHAPLPEAPAPRERRGLSGCAIAGIVFGILAVLALAGLLLVAQPFIDQVKRKQARLVCTNNLSQLAALVAANGPGAPPRTGPAVFLEWRKRGVIERGEERVLLCPLDPDAIVRDTPEWRARWDDVDLDDPGRGLCSYAVRDFAKFPVSAATRAPVPIAACLHHTETAIERGGAVVAFSDGAVAWLGYEELGISEGSELIAGPKSKAKLLRELVAPPATPQRR